MVVARYSRIKHLLGLREELFLAVRALIDGTELIEANRAHVIYCEPKVMVRHVPRLGAALVFLLRLRVVERDEPSEVLVDVEAACVVLGDQLLDTLHEGLAGRVASGRGGCSLLEQRCQPVGLGPFAAGERRGE